MDSPEPVRSLSPELLASPEPMGSAERMASPEATGPPEPMGSPRPLGEGGARPRPLRPLAHSGFAGEHMAAGAHGVGRAHAIA